MSGDRAPLYSGSIAKADSSRAAVSALDSLAEICLVSISVPPRAAEPSAPGSDVDTPILGIELDSRLDHRQPGFA